MFKVLFVVAICAFLALPTEAVVSNQLMLAVRPKLRQCAKDWNVSDADLNAIIANDLSNQNRNNQCLSLCFLNQLGMFNMDGTINEVTAKLKFSLGERFCFVNKVVDKCKQLRGYDACNQAWTVYSCFVNEHLL